MMRILPLAAGAALALTACTGGGDATTGSGSTSPSASASTSAATIVLDDAFCDDAEELYQRDLAVSDALATLDPSSMSSADMADPDVFEAYLAAIDLDGWDDWRTLYEQAAADSGSAEMEAWIATIVAATDQQFAVYAEAAETTTTLTEWGEQVSALLAAQDELEVEGDEALRASEASMATCGVPLSVAAGEILGYEG